MSAAQPAKAQESRSTMQTMASAPVTISAGGEPGPGVQAAAPTTPPAPINSASLTTGGLLVGTASAAGSGVTVIASGESPASSAPAPAAAATSAASSPAPSSAPAEAASSSPSAPISTSVAAQSQVAANAPPQPTIVGSSNAAAPPSAPFDINTVALQSRVTVNLGRRVAKPTQMGAWW
ncbi:hypothetical protein A1F95_08386 [Pyrenophora tritici-repentis]|nr:hypothetical protein A1F95_08386 [Pyrenophora tritici-repentis]